MSGWSELLVLLALVGSALMAGTFFIFSTTIMRSLAKLAPAEGIRAMQAINRVILNPWFMGSFMGTAILSLVIGVLAFTGWPPFASPWFMGAAMLYLSGTFFATAFKNVPLNDELAKVTPEQAPEFWPFYLSKWTRYNHGRTVASTLAVILYAIGLMQL